MSTSSSQTGSILWAPNKHIPELDGIRGFAILIVTLYRFSRELPHGGLGSVIETTFSLGDRGVDLFFVLSGFLITGVLLDRRGDAKPIFNFIMRRSLRIFPLYFAALAILLGISRFVPGFRGVFQQAEDNQFYLWTYLTNVKMSIDAKWCFGALDHFWSLSVEEHFYLLWPALVLALVPNRLASKGAAPRSLIPNRLLVTTLSVAIICAILRIGMALVSENRVATDVLSIFRFDSLLLGGAIAILARIDEQPRQKWRSAAWSFLLASGLVVAAFAVLGRSVFTVSHSAWAVFWTSGLYLVITSSSGSRVATVLRSRLLRTLGKYSYAMYVFQSPLIPLAAPVLGVAILSSTVGQTAATLIYVPLMCLLCFAAALLSWHLLEKHMLKLKKHF